MNSALDHQARSALDRFCAAWNSNDGASVGGCFTEDGSLVNPFGQRADGRASVTAMYTSYFTGMLRGTSTVFQLASARAVGDDHLFVDGVQTVKGADGQLVLVLHLAALLRREGDGWRFVDSRPYSYATPPPA